MRNSVDPGATRGLLGALPWRPAAAAATRRRARRLSGFVATSLVSDVNSASNPYSGSNVDPNLVNAWGIAFNPQGFVWVANNGTSTSTLYDGNGVPQSLVVVDPAPARRARPARPASSSTARRDFKVTQGGVSGAERLHLRRRRRHDRPAGRRA